MSSKQTPSSVANSLNPVGNEFDAMPVVNGSGPAGYDRMVFGTIGLQNVPFLGHNSYSKALTSDSHRPVGQPPAGNAQLSNWNVTNRGNHGTAMAVRTPVASTPQLAAPSKTIHLDLDSGDERDELDELDWTPPFKNCSTRIFEATMRSHNPTNSEGKRQATRVPSFASSASDDVVIEAPKKGKAPVKEVNVMGSYNVKLGYLMYTKKGVNPLKTSVQKMKSGAGKWMAYRIEPTSKIIDIDDNNFLALKDLLFTIADTIDQDAPPGGNSAIFKLADASGSVSITAYIDRHDVFSRSKGRKLVKDQDVQDFFAAVQLAPLKEAGLHIAMSDPAKSAKMADTKIAMAQSRLKAISAMNNSTVSSSQLADSIPLDPIQVNLESLIKKYGSLENHSREGWRVYKPLEASKFMQMNYEHLHKWAQELAEAQAGVDLENPPMYLNGFKWTDVKRPLSTAAGPPTAKKNKAADADFPNHEKPGGYAECQGYHISVTREGIEEVKKFSTFEEFLDYAGIAPFFVKELAEAFGDHHIDSFDQFLFPEIMDIRDVLRLGISWGMAMKLFAQSRLFYAQITKEIASYKTPSPPKGPTPIKTARFADPVQSTPTVPRAGPSQFPGCASRD
ncbi:uncharacterized protein MELLADRAFT_70314 [Melampsora larici-populina 98AG31]|uniref:Uncharacterized protein n=1 Tax=Melampsora larici-populina (strain 98AG31 / pathotype 3-4-7) TaxID=747676 RepID=F4SEG6_MELLP|nr:uncharacterized protein MELLADRAFT_70314 [Melampsora larici-populina 98AG31]EGF96960.1 hypothetical protein MELLADRAFT_70314 [Melampsora larici-populina 98AG31]